MPITAVNLRKRILIGRLYLRMGRRFRQTYYAALGSNMNRQSIRLGLRMFVARAERRHPYTASQLARELGIPRVSVLRHLQRLIDVGYVQRVGTRYEIIEETMAHPA